MKKRHPVSADFFKAMAALPDQIFVFEDAHDPTVVCEIPLLHEVAGPAGAKDLEQLGALLPETIALRILPFYAEVNGAELFKPSGSQEACVQLASIGLIESFTKQYRSWLDQFEEVELESDDLAWATTAIALARIPSEATYFLLALAGNQAGKILRFTHDGLEFQVWAENFDAFIRKLWRDPIGDLCDTISCYPYVVRPSDKLWFPSRWIHPATEA